MSVGAWLLGNAPTSGQERKLQVVATYSVVADLVAQVAGDKAEVKSLVPAGTDPHTYEPKPGDVRLLAEADLVVYHGLNLELWFDRLVQGSRTRAPVAVASAGLKPIIIQDPLSRFQGAPDPHGWMDVQLVIDHYVPNITKALQTADPRNGAAYKAKGKEFLQRLADLHHWIKGQVASIPPSRRKLVTTENALHYFAARYGFEVVGWVYTLAPEADPSPKRLVELVEKIRAKQVPALFIDVTLNPRLVERLSQETGVPIGGALYIDSLGPPGSGADTYIGMMRANVERLVSGLGEKR